MVLSETGQWLEEALTKICSDPGSTIHLDSETLHSLVSYCEMAPATDASEYLMNIVGDDRCIDIVEEYLRRKGGTNSTSAVGMQAYVKPREEMSWSTSSKKTAKQKAGAGEPSAGPSQKYTDHKSPLYSGHGVLSAENIVQKGKRAVGKGKKTSKGISLAEASKGLAVLASGSHCTCLCTIHKLINNCLSCGRIVCEQEGEGPCHFCGALVLREGSDYGGLEGLPVPPATDAEKAAEDFKNRLVEYDRSAASRTTVIDDQSDYFQIEGNTWLSEQEKKLLQQRRDEEKRIAEERRKRVIVTIDLLGRKVVMAGEGNEKQNGDSISILGSEVFMGQDLPKVSRVRPNPHLAESPVFVDTRQDTKFTGSSTSDKYRSSSRKPTELLRTSRIQHDDPLVEALIGHNLEDIGIEVGGCSNLWQAPKAAASGQGEEEDFLECRSEKLRLSEPSGTNMSKSAAGLVQPMQTYAIDIQKGSDPVPMFDICPPRASGKQKSVVLLPSILVQKQMERMEAASETDGKVKQQSGVLLPGMVILKAWLSPDQQVEIAKSCGKIGTGPGGFYQPQFLGTNTKMHLKMMCLGMQWEPQSKSYGTCRLHYDNAPAPSIPDSFMHLVDKALMASQVVATPDWRGKSKKVVLDKTSTEPGMVPNVCIINFYEHSGNLGMHQDKDESPESLQRGCPVVSFSIGDSAEFIYGKLRDADKSEKVILESGDVLIFGGPSRMIYHGVTRVITGTAPSWLSQKANLRPGRLNLTFRQY